MFFNNCKTSRNYKFKYLADNLLPTFELSKTVQASPEKLFSKIFSDAKNGSFLTFKVKWQHIFLAFVTLVKVDK